MNHYVFVPEFDAFIAYNTDKTQYAFGCTDEGALKKLHDCPRTPINNPPKLTLITGELIALGKLSDETRLQILDYEAFLVLEAG